MRLEYISKKGKKLCKPSSSSASVSSLQVLHQIWKAEQREKCINGSSKTMLRVDLHVWFCHGRERYYLLLIVLRGVVAFESKR